MNGIRSRLVSVLRWTALSGWSALLLLTFGVIAAEAAPRAYVANDDNAVSVIDIPSHTVVATVPVGDTPFEVALTPAGASAYVTNCSDNTVSVISISTHTVVATVPVGVCPVGVAITPF